MSLLPTLGYALDAGSGVLLMALGLLVARVRPQRPVQAAFSLFAIAFGSNLLIGNLLSSDDPWKTATSTLAAAFVLPAAAGLAYVAWAFPAPPGPGERRAALLVAAFTALLAAPFLLALSRDPPPADYALGLQLLQFVFYLATLLLPLRFAAATGPGSPRVRQQVALTAIALAAWPALFISSRLSPTSLDEALRGSADDLWALAGLVAFAAAAALWLRATRSPEPAAPRLARDAALATLGALLAALLLAQTASALGVSYGSSGAYGASRIVTTALLAYAILRHRLFDIDLRIKRGLHRSTVVAAFVALYVVAAGAAQLALAPQAAAWAGIAFTAVLVLFLAPLQRAAQRVVDTAMPGVEATPEYLTARKLDVYRAALDQCIAADGTLAEPQLAMLAALREELGLTDRDHAVLEHAARAALGRGAARLEPGAVVLGKYRVERLLGEGSFGRTFLAEDLLLKRPVVIKALRPERAGDPRQVEAVLREGRLLSAVRHPNLAAIHGMERVGGNVLLVLEYADGGSLEDVLRAKGRLPLDEALRIADGLLAGLEAAHAAGVVHCDVKPGNVLLTRDGGVKVSDFGAARRAEPDEGATQSGLTVDAAAGTLATMAPEVARGAPAGPAADLYGAAAVLYRMLAGKHYIDLKGRTDFEAREAILTHGFQPVRGAPAAVNDALAKALAKDPGARFTDARAMRKALALAAGERARAATRRGTP